MQRWLLCTSSLLAGLAISTPTWAQKVPVGADFQLNETTYGSQGVWHGVELAADAAGNFVVVWDGYVDAGGRLFDSAGNPLGGDFQFGGQGSTDDPAVSRSPTGEFVVVWGRYDIFAQRYDPNGVPVGAEFQVNTFSTSSPRNPKVAMDANGNFMVVWGQFNTEGPGISGQLFDSAGNVVGGEFAVDTVFGDSDGYNGVEEDDDGIEIAAGAAGNFVVVWQNSSFAYGRRILVRPFDSTGTPTSAPFALNASTTQHVGYPGIGTDGLGNFVVTWRDDSYYHLRGRRLDSSGSPIGTEFQVQEAVYAIYPNYSQIAADATGNFVVVWQESPWVRVRQFDSTATPVGAEFELPLGGYYPYGRGPDVAFTGGGDFVVAWAEYRDYGYYSYDIFAQRFGTPPGPCSATPKTTCRVQTKDRGAFRFRHGSTPNRTNLAWRWPTGESTSREELGDPRTDTGYALCVYDASNDPQPILQAAVPAGGTCGTIGIQCWRELSGKGPPVEYFDPAAATDGIRRIRLKPSDNDRVRIAVQGMGSVLALPDTPLTAPVTAQLQATNGVCFTAAFDARIRKNEGGVFRARPGSPSEAFLDVAVALLD